jgi:hypothetical protein
MVFSPVISCPFSRTSLGVWYQLTSRDGGTASVVSLIWIGRVEYIFVRNWSAVVLGERKRVILRQTTEVPTHQGQ